MNNKEVAKNTREAFNLLIQPVVLKARNGDTNAAKKVIELMTSENLALRALGYGVSDFGRLILFKNIKNYEK